MNVYVTDKRSEEHNYVPHYEEAFESLRNKELKVLEIGIFRPYGETRKDAAVGASLKTWKDYFSKSMIYGIDISDFSDINEDRLFTWICDQESRPQLQNFINISDSEFDIIIDDGGHLMRQHQVSIGFLFKHLKQGGIYVIEDLHSCDMPYCRRDDESTIDVMNRFTETGSFHGKHILPEEAEYLSNNIERIDIKMAAYSEIAFIYKKK